MNGRVPYLYTVSLAFLPQMRRHFTPVSDTSRRKCAAALGRAETTQEIGAFRKGSGRLIEPIKDKEEPFYHSHKCRVSSTFFRVPSPTGHGQGKSKTISVHACKVSYFSFPQRARVQIWGSSCGDRGRRNDTLGALDSRNDVIHLLITSYFFIWFVK